MTVVEQYGPLLGIGLQTVIFLLAGYAMVIRTNSSTENLKEEVVSIKEEMKQLAIIMTKMAVATERLDTMSKRMNMQEQRMDELSKGVGWKTARRAVDGDEPY